MCNGMHKFAQVTLKSSELMSSVAFNDMESELFHPEMVSSDKYCRMAGVGF
jgi:hypothetical protein